MKRLTVFCDGTWNGIAADHPTNVLIGSQLVQSTDADGVLQVVFYDEGVGTSEGGHGGLNNLLAGAFGNGLFTKIADAYRFLIFNYAPGDEIYIFGFSRGAYTARSLAGLIRKCGIIPRSEAKEIQKAFDFYKDAATHPDSDEARQRRLEWCPGLVLKDDDRQWQVAHGRDPALAQAAQLLSIRYLGVWDTVGALGIPAHLPGSEIINGKKYQFHDTQLSSTVESARHAVSVDEDRLSFAPSLWSNLPDLNEIPGKKGLYQQLWFPGDHGSVGGGGDIRGLSDFALAWILEGARLQGLALDDSELGRLKAGSDPWAALRNVSAPPGFLDTLFQRGPREGPQQKSELAESTFTRLYDEQKSRHSPYRPETLKRLWPQGTG